MEDSKITLVKITSLEANGYDDSDWDTIYYNVADKSVLHDFGTTRGYTTSSLPANSEIISLENAVSSNVTQIDNFISIYLFCKQIDLMI